MCMVVKMSRRQFCLIWTCKHSNRKVQFVSLLKCIQLAVSRHRRAVISHLIVETRLSLESHLAVVRFFCLKLSLSTDVKSNVIFHETRIALVFWHPTLLCACYLKIDSPSKNKFKPCTNSQSSKN